MSKSATDWIKLMLSTGEYADVHFLVGDGDEKKIIPAHQLILKNASDVFEAMFRFDSKNAKAGNASANCPVEVPDVEPTAFKVMLSFIYTDDLSGLSGHNAMAVLYVAKKYNIPGLVGPALRIPVWKLRNVFLGVAQARLFGLEKYAEDCLDYIDKNAETLVKSKSFLEIDQKLLCELLERDQLQIRGEISVWEAALRWADEQCHQNGINCSAENRRQMLGPVLFKIRFQFFSKDAFSKKIVPSNVLTAEEVISVEKYHNHLFDDILYPLQFSNRNRCSSFATLLMDIEKMRNFSLEPMGSRRYSETLSKKGMSWKMETAINRTRSDHGTDNNDKKCLSLYLLCAPSTAEDPNWSCACSATFQIVSRMNDEAKNWTDKFSAVFTNSNKGWGFPSFITLAELMDPSNGFYDKDEDKVTLAIHFTVNPNQKTGRKFQSLLDPK